MSTAAPSPPIDAIGWLVRRRDRNARADWPPGDPTVAPSPAAAGRYRHVRQPQPSAHLPKRPLAGPTVDTTTRGATRSAPPRRAAREAQAAGQPRSAN